MEPRQYEDEGDHSPEAKADEPDQSDKEAAQQSHDKKHSKRRRTGQRNG